ncbi:gamma-tubulin complex subunit, putative [Trypanosoma equiperdum]|uniref:Spindle pole body component n=2 Tax=Trypanozoon TaxID=39700 RepID=Q389Z9_TRYB2|nr:gamma-tubulin complex subunit, putative [Trypanosoma brucei brucei TREU927]EAN78371.1 gamma-tubulin complex subunit, putative [Trypanosoma brucei brucei TREU927]SCU67149.1 gamma-tubulin complex subunit, putative [Trypanosoma equiperdum]
MTTHLWANFVTSLESRGISFQHVQHASDRSAVISAAGFGDPISVAILETEWMKRCAPTSTQHASPVGVSDKGAFAPPPPLQAPQTAAATVSSPTRLAPQFSDHTKLEDVPEEIQDRVITAEVLAAAVGNGGSLLQASRDGFVVSRYVPVSMRGLCKTIVPIADSFVALRKVERAEYMGKSLVAMALGEAVSEICTSYAHEIANLQRWSQKKAMPLMGVVSEVLRAGHHIVRLRQVLPTDSILEEEGTLSMAGWRLLNHIHEQAEKHSGSREDDELLNLLLRRASVPYLRVLHRWVHEGVVEDPYGEFFISDASLPTGAASTTTAAPVSAVAGMKKSAVRRIFPPCGGGGDDYGETGMDDAHAFERRFSMNKNMVPNFILTNTKMAKIVFYTGKYCCLLREYNGALPSFGELSNQILIWSGVDELHRRIEESYEIASGEVLQLFLGPQVDLLGHLTSLKSYFLHQRSDWLIDFLDSAEELLLKSPFQVKAHSVRVLLQAAIARCCGKDLYHTLIGCSFSGTTVAQDIINSHERQNDESPQRASTNGRRSATRIETRCCIELLQLEADLKWPLTMVIDPPVLEQFNIVFRLFTWLKTCERDVTTSWTGDTDLDPHYQRAYIIKHQLIQFIRQFQFYAAHFVVEPLWGRMMNRICQADSIFAVNSALKDFFKGIELGLVLSSATRFRSLARILEIASVFSETGRPGAAQGLSEQRLQEILQDVETQFLKALSELASPVGADYPQLVPLLTWIDFSGYYDRNGVYRVLYSASAATEPVSSSATDRRKR